VLFLVAAGLQLVFGVTKILNLACGSFYALGAYAGVSAVRWALGAGLPTPLFLPVLLGAGLALAVIGPVIERLLRPIYDRDESFQLLLTFALVLMLEDVIRFFWGTAPHQLGNVYLAYGRLRVGALTVPTYNLVVIACGAAIAVGMGLVLARTRFGRIVRATAENREMAEAMGVDMARVYSRVFTLGVALGTVGGALVIPATAAINEMGIDVIVEAFAVVVIGGLGSMRGAFAGALIVGVVKAVAIATWPEVEMLAVYVIVIAVLVMRPAGLFARAIA
jgi:branched-chain amino acid transport system permease protein